MCATFYGDKLMRLFTETNSNLFVRVKTRERKKLSALYFDYGNKNFPFLCDTDTCMSVIPNCLLNSDMAHFSKMCYAGDCCRKKFAFKRKCFVGFPVSHCICSEMKHWFVCLVVYLHHLFFFNPLCIIQASYGMHNQFGQILIIWGHQLMFTGIINCEKHI